MPSSGEARCSLGTVVVTGGGGGIGAAVSKFVARAGYAVIAVDIAPLGLDKLTADAKSEGLNICTVVGDTSEEQVNHDVFTAAADNGMLHGAVLCAGATIHKPFMETSLDNFMFTFRVNLLSTFLGLREAGLVLASQGKGGSLIAVSSINAMRPLPEQASYSAAKAGIESLVRSASEDLGPSRVRVNSLAPGGVNTPMNPIPDQRNTYAPHIALRRAAEPEDMCGTVEFLLSDKSRYITGATIVVDGGLMNHR
ncbi:MAG: hypothetical protein B5766_03255 [Candidatus Lumbricidophila eiseniae]|uniref:Ketoreductase domain-containing protein n=1 Tax=Candidatus Lumbricidiphila eiseniae TaxID=1969409 RepID=A0A2A6FTF3_9MICO|nr:MAG: hypothetical protein B5766_03255 [Candidatus Lumbricidophila eiseniae]